jgi:hypothetical protein
MRATSIGRGLATVVALLLIAVLCAVGILGMRSAVVRAAEEPTTTKGNAVAVVDFLNNSGFNGPALGRSAADALVLALDETKMFEPLQRSEVDQALARLGFTIPLNRVAQARLGQELLVDRVASGVINNVHFEQTAQGRVAVADITVTLLAVDSQEYVNGARVVRSSTPKPGYTADDAELVDEALTLATYQAARSMITTKGPAITIIGATPTEVYLNAGSRSGLQDGTELVVMRFGEKVGRLKVIKIDPTNATAAIVADYRGITVGDVATPVFEPPSAERAPAVSRTGNRQKLGAMVLGVAAAAGIFFTLSRHSPADQPVPFVAASSFADATGTRKGVLVTWSPSSHQRQDLVAFEIFRNDAVTWVKPAVGADPTGGSTFFIDEAMPTFDGMTARVDATIDATSGALTAYTLTTPDPSDTEPPGSGGATDQTFFRIWIHTPPTEGATSVYRVVAVVTDVVFVPATTTTTGGTTTGTTTTASTSGTSILASRSRAAAASSRQATFTRNFVLKESPYGGASSATFVAPPKLVAPTPGAAVTDLTAVVFTWNAVAGADQYILELSRDAFFLPASTRTFTFDLAPAAGAAITQTIDASAIFPPPATGTMTLHWRVGARNSRDPYPPRTDPALFQGFPQDQGWVWGTPGSAAFSFTAPTGGATAAGRAPRRIRLMGPRPQ